MSRNKKTVNISPRADKKVEAKKKQMELKMYE